MKPSIDRRSSLEQQLLWPLDGRHAEKVHNDLRRGSCPDARSHVTGPGRIGRALSMLPSWDTHLSKRGRTEKALGSLRPRQIPALPCALAKATLEPFDRPVGSGRTTSPDERGAEEWNGRKAIWNRYGSRRRIQEFPHNLALWAVGSLLWLHYRGGSCWKDRLEHGEASRGCRRLAPSCVL